MKILICDDDNIILDSLKNMIIKNMKEIAPEEAVSVETFSGVFGLYDYIEAKKQNIDAVFIDIALNGDNGIEVAGNIVKKYPHIKIIFCTGNTVYAESVFDVNPIYMLIKPINKDRFAAALKKLYEEVEKEKSRYITVKSAKEIYRILEKDIYYLESEGRYVKIHTENECIKVMDTLAHMQEILKGSFTWCHKSYMVNINKIKKFENTKVTLYNGMEISVSRRYKSRVREDILSYI